MNILIKQILLGILTALLFSAFIYFQEYNLTNKFINTFFGLLSLTLLLYISKRSILVTGFSIGILWFYWIGYSFEYQGVGYMMPIITLGFGVLYLLFFLPLYFTNKVYLRALLLFGLSFIEPFDWNWLQIELLFVDSYIGVYKYQLFLVLLGLSLFDYIHLKKGQNLLALVFIIAAFNYGYPTQNDSQLKIKLVQTEIKQEDKWTKSALLPTVNLVYKEIQKATTEGYDLVVFPESVFPLYMNRSPKLMQQILLASHSIDIIAGSLLRQNNQNYNVTYYFENGNYHIAKKLVLVPFGEYIPLPKFMRRIINDTFFSGASDFVTAQEPTDFTIKGVKFRNAICYEATCQEIYEGDVDFVLATSNNAWFAPSIEPTLQKLLMRYYARKNGVTIYHAANYKGTGVIK